jgi:hypothetical protein
LHVLQRNLHATGKELFWILNAYLLMLASLISISGSLGDKKSITFIDHNKQNEARICMFDVAAVHRGIQPGYGNR